MLWGNSISATTTFSLHESTVQGVGGSAEDNGEAAGRGVIFTLEGGLMLRSNCFVCSISVDCSRHIPIISEIKVPKYLSMCHNKWIGHVWLALDTLENLSLIDFKCNVYYVVEALEHFSFRRPISPANQNFEFNPDIAGKRGDVIECKMPKVEVAGVPIANTDCVCCTYH